MSGIPSNVVKEVGLPVIDIHREVFANHPDPVSFFPLRTGGHFTAEAYAEIAKAIVAKIKNEQQRPLGNWSDPHVSKD